MQRLGQTAVLGELLAGVLIGPGVLGLVHESEILRALAEIAVVILLFEEGGLIQGLGCNQQPAGIPCLLLAAGHVALFVLWDVIFCGGKRCKGLIDRMF